MSVKVTLKDQGLKRLLNRLKKAEGVTLEVGVIGSKARKIHPKTGVPVGLIAFWQEFGTENAPARPFMRTTHFTQKQTFQKSLAIQLGKATRGEKTFIEAAAAVGRRMALETRKTIGSALAWAKPNRPSTILKKGFNRPLYETGVLLNSVTYLVRQKGRFAAAGDHRK